jgi:hypothetical protein
MPDVVHGGRSARGDLRRGRHREQQPQQRDDPVRDHQGTRRAQGTTSAGRPCDPDPERDHQRRPDGGDGGERAFSGEPVADSSLTVCETGS